MVNYVADPGGKNRADADAVASEIGAALIVECDVPDHAAWGEWSHEVQSKLGGSTSLSTTPASSATGRSGR